MTEEHGPRDVVVSAGAVQLPGSLAVPVESKGIVVFAHGSGSSRLSTRNRAVARRLRDAGCATLLFDLLTDEEAADRRNVFDVALLGRRVLDATAWLGARRELAGRPVGYFGASTGAAAALIAAAELGDAIAAVVSRGGRPDLAGDALGRVTAPVLLIVGDRDTEVLRLNRDARAQLRCESAITLVQGATHLFEEPGALEAVADAAAAWFVERFTGAGGRG